MNSSSTLVAREPGRRSRCEAPPLLCLLRQLPLANALFPIRIDPADNFISVRFRQRRIAFVFAEEKNCLGCLVLRVVELCAQFYEARQDGNAIVTRKALCRV